ncbi:MAG: hypothetical protein LC723_11735, partial [Actinobacteria bacterium]|nr:hypothetical protein [Actinomycetota bacterium]
MDTRTRPFLLLSVVAMFATLTVGAAFGAARDYHFDESGIQGSSNAVMQQVTVPARIARVDSVPGSAGAEVWAIGLSTAELPGWD